VHFLDPLPKDCVPHFLRCCDAMFIGLQRQPLFRFGISPNKLMDYMAAGKPIISAIDAGNDAVAEARCGFSVRAEDAAAIANAVIRLMHLSADERARMGEAGRAYVRTKHDYAVLAAQFLSLMSNPDISSDRPET
jgi:glycosyltransferase involved in cell wall biosynthesis